MNQTRTVIGLALGVMHVALAAALVFVLGQIGDPASQPVRWPQLALVMLVAVIVGQLLGDDRKRHGIIAVGGAGLIALALKSILGGGLNPLAGWQAVFAGETLRIQEVLLSVAALVFVLIRGLTVHAWSNDEITAFLRQGLGLLMGGLVMAVLSGSRSYTTPVAVELLTSYSAAFVASGLLALALHHSTSFISDNAKRPAIVGTALLVGLLIGGVLLIVSLVTESGRTALGNVVGALFDVVVGVVGVVAGGIYVVVFGLINALKGERTVIIEPDPTAQPSDKPVQGPVWEQITETASGASPWFDRLVQGLALLLILLVVRLVVRWVLQRWRMQRGTMDDGEQRVSVWSWQQFGRDLRGLLDNLAPKRRAYARSLTGNTPVVRVRRAYRRLLELGARAEQPHQPDQTPHEYRAVASFVPTATPTLDELTTAYEHARYGSETSEQAALAAEHAVREIERAWARR